MGCLTLPRSMRCWKGLFIGATFCLLTTRLFAAKAPNIIMNAVGLNFRHSHRDVFFIQFQNHTGLLKNLKRVIFTATAGIAIFYLIAMVLRMFGVQIWHF